MCSFPAHRMDDRRLQLSGEPYQLITCSFAAGTAQEGDAPSAVQKRGHTVDALGRRGDCRTCWCEPQLLRRRRIESGLQRDVTRYDNDRNTTLCNCAPDRDFQCSRHLPYTRHELAKAAALPKEPLRMGLLEVPRTDLRRRDVRGDSNDRHARPMTVEESVEQVQVVGPTTSRTDGEPTGEIRVGAGGECRHLFVPDVQPIDSAMAPQCVGKAVQAIANDPVNASNPCGG